MGIYYRATTVIGYRISTKNCHTTVQVPNCSHNPPDDVKFCPSCGRKVGTRTNRITNSQFDEFMDETRNHLPEGYVFEELYDGSGDQFWFGYGSHSDEDESVRLEPISYSLIKERIDVLLGPLVSTGLFQLDEAEFGIWTIHSGS